ncbi:FAD-binding protein [Helicobacter sp. MIT 05-5293]|nr:FAD-binding protein [Helicobacter sp. MIT 05-5293]
MQPDYQGFVSVAKSALKGRIYTDYLRRFAYGTDASCYRYVPQVVVRAKNEKEICQLFKWSLRFNVPLSFRAAGTSLSGQACSEGVLVLANSYWQDMKFVFNPSDSESKHKKASSRNSMSADSESPQSIWLSCGVIGSDANAALKPFGKKIGPDPATINNAMIGGIFSNNSSGMCCGVKQNSYNTIKSVRVILHDGFVLDTSDEKNLHTFMRTHKGMVDSLLALREQILADSKLKALIKRKFAIKNTTGYSLNALLDFSDIKDILNHIFIGAEGTLGFVSRVEYECVEDYAFKACALLFYENLLGASEAVKILAHNEDIVSAAEMMDYGCLDAVSHLEGIPEIIFRAKKGNCALLVQLEDSTKEGLESKVSRIKSALKSAPSLFGEEFSYDSKQQDSWWKIRKGLLPISASTRRSGSTVITEDICFETESFAPGMEKITTLFEKYHFEGIIFGHALSGNVHFIITPLLGDDTERENFARFMDDMVDMVVSLGGSTKAEHGTGRMMAPFVEKEWGKKAYALNRRIKEIFDAKNLINPDVIICDDNTIHLKNLKPANAIEDFINQCMECGFCEKVCPSKDLTLTPRQRIAVRREIARLEELEAKGLLEDKITDSVIQESAQDMRQSTQSLSPNSALESSQESLHESSPNPAQIDSQSSYAHSFMDTLKSNANMIVEKGTKDIASKIAKHQTHAPLTQKEILKELKKGYAYFGVQTCATCSMCASLCPLEIDTAKIASKLKREQAGFVAKRVANNLATHLPRTMKWGRNAIKVANFGSKYLGAGIAKSLSKGAHKVFSTPIVPTFMPKPNTYMLESKTSPENKSSVIYFSTCINRMFAPSVKMPDKRPIQEVFENVCRKAGVNVLYPQNLENLCCGKAFKDYQKPSDELAYETYKELVISASEEKLDIVCDHSACTYELLKRVEEFAKHSGISIKLYDMPQYIAQVLLPKLSIAPLEENIGLYMMCATKKGKWSDTLYQVAKACIKGEIIIHQKTECCGFAGNKGFTTPELNESALKEFKAFYEGLGDKKISHGYGSSSTCEIGLSEQSGFGWQNLIYLVDKCSQ